MAEQSGASIVVTRRVEWADTDASGHYHYVTVFRLVESAETELWLELGLHEQRGRIPRVHVTADFRRALWYPQEVEVGLRVADLGRSSLTYAFEIRRDGEICSAGRMVVARRDTTGNSQPWPEDVRAGLLGGG